MGRMNMAGLRPDHSVLENYVVEQFSKSGLDVVGPVHYGFARLQDRVAAVKSLATWRRARSAGGGRQVPGERQATAV